MRDLVEIELARSREIIAGGVELVPRFRISTPDGESLMFVQLPDDLDERNRRMQLVASYMAVHLARSFVMSSELVEPDAHSAVAVSRNGTMAALQVVRRTPVLTFSEPVWLDAHQIGDELPAMLPGRVESVTPEQIAAVDDLIRHNEGLRLEPL